MEGPPASEALQKENTVDLLVELITQMYASMLRRQDVGQDVGCACGVTGPRTHSVSRYVNFFSYEQVFQILGE